jgi:hypothetical protein
MLIRTVDRRRLAGRSRRDRIRRSTDRRRIASPTAPSSLPTLHELLAQDRFVPLAVALERGGLDIVIDGLDDFVLLAPNGAAFASSGADIGVEYSTLMNDPRLLEAIMRYHIVADPSTNQSWRTLNGSALDVDGSDAQSAFLSFHPAAATVWSSCTHCPAPAERYCTPVRRGEQGRVVATPSAVSHATTADGCPRRPYAPM